MTATVSRLLSGGYLVDNGSAFPTWIADRGDAYAEAAARTLIAPAGTSEHPSLSSPRECRPGSDCPTFAASGAGTPRGAGVAVAGVHDPRIPATHNQPGRSAA